MKYTSLFVLMLATSGCFRGAGLFAAVAGTAIVTAAIISTRPPPPPRVVYVPAPRAGYVWQSGYWTLEGDEWVWVEGRWMPMRVGYSWAPTHWEGLSDGTWRLVPGHWVAVVPGPEAPME